MREEKTHKIRRTFSVFAGKEHGRIKKVGSKIIEFTVADDGAILSEREIRRHV